MQRETSHKQREVGLTFGIEKKIYFFSQKVAQEIKSITFAAPFERKD